MRIHSLAALVVACTFSSLSVNALACGESLFRVGKGVHFREYTAPLPGSIVMIARTEAELAMVERLAAAGHDMHVVADPAELADELARHDIDIVLAWFSQRQEVAAQAGHAGVEFIPVAADGELSAALSEYAHALSGDDSVKTFLKTIHRTLKSRA